MIPTRHLAALVSLGVALGPTMAAAQCRPPATSHEARLLAFYEAPIAFSMAGAPEELARGAIRIGGEAIPVPSPTPALQHPEYCYANTTNNTRLAPLFGRPRVAIGLPAGFTTEASYLPDVHVAGAEATVASIALARTQRVPLTGGRVTSTFRLDGTTGRVRGAITCPRSSLQITDANVPCYGREPSRDTFAPNSAGVEAALGVDAVDDRVALYAGAGVSWLQPRFQAGFTDAFGNVDHTTVIANLTRGVAFTGITWRVLGTFSASAQLYAVPADVTTIRVSVHYGWN